MFNVYRYYSGKDEGRPMCVSGLVTAIVDSLCLTAIVVGLFRCIRFYLQYTV